MRTMPTPVRELRNGWPSRIAEVKFLNEELEKDFRFGQRISKTDRGYLMGGTIKGGSSSMWYPSSEKHYQAYLDWRCLEGIVDQQDDEAYEGLLDLLGSNSIALSTRTHQAFPTAPSRDAAKADSREVHDPQLGFIYRTIYDVLNKLPSSHLGRPQLERLRLGGWGPDSAKASAYANGAVLMYDFAIRGAKRTFFGLLLHELGHAHENAMSPATRNELYKHYRVIAEADAFLGVEFLLDASTRRLYQKFVFNEFLAESYLVYTACGKALRTFIAGLEGSAQRSWEEVYAIFRATFDHVEYA